MTRGWIVFRDIPGQLKLWNFDPEKYSRFELEPGTRPNVEPKAAGCIHVLADLAGGRAR